MSQCKCCGVNKEATLASTKKLLADNKTLRQQIVMLRDSFMPLILHRHTTNDSEYRAAEKAIADTEPKP